jgi:hypothetical protein
MGMFERIGFFTNKVKHASYHIRNDEFMLVCGNEEFADRVDRVNQCLWRLPA